MKQDRFNAPAGFTLVEAMVASVIMLFAMASVLALTSLGFRYLHDLRRWGRSSQVLQQKMEDIRIITVWTNIWALNNTTFTDNNPTGFVYRGRIDITSYDPPYPTSIAARVTIMVTWTNTLRHPMTNRISSLVAQYGLNKYIF